MSDRVPKDMGTGLDIWIYCHQFGIIYIIVVFNSDNYVPVLDNLAPIENITSFGQFCPNYGQLNIFTFNGTLFNYTYPFDYTYPLYYPYPHQFDSIGICD